MRDTLKRQRVLRIGDPVIIVSVTLVGAFFMFYFGAIRAGENEARVAFMWAMGAVTFGTVFIWSKLTLSMRQKYWAFQVYYYNVVARFKRDLSDVSVVVEEGADLRVRLTDTAIKEGLYYLAGALVLAERDLKKVRFDSKWTDDMLRVSLDAEQKDRNRFNHLWNVVKNSFGIFPELTREDVFRTVVERLVKLNK